MNKYLSICLNISNKDLKKNIEKYFVDNYFFIKEDNYPFLYYKMNSDYMEDQVYSFANNVISEVIKELNINEEICSSIYFFVTNVKPLSYNKKNNSIFSYL